VRDSKTKKKKVRRPQCGLRTGKGRERNGTEDSIFYFFFRHGIEEEGKEKKSKKSGLVDDSGGTKGKEKEGRGDCTQLILSSFLLVASHKGEGGKDVAPE